MAFAWRQWRSKEGQDAQAADSGAQHGVAGFRRLPAAMHHVGRALAAAPASDGGVRFDNVVFAGGGNRCFWQAGFWSVAAPALGIRPARVAAVSAGAAIACSVLADNFYLGFRHYKRALAANASNIHLRNLLGDRPLFPHGSMYRDTLLTSIDERALTRLKRGPEISILVSRPPAWASPRVALLLGMIATSIDDWRGECVHTSAGSRIGFRPLFLSARDCPTPEALADLIIASSCVPPLTPQARHNGAALFDGGFFSNIPAQGVAGAQGETLVLLTRRFARLPAIAGRTYVQPSQAIPVAAWDYTNVGAVQATFDLGRRDAERFCAAQGVTV